MELMKERDMRIVTQQVPQQVDGAEEFAHVGL
jgi:hypothetical protein